jgi:non-ribosomal peptide synthetase component E (peptide arylation enzyme)
MSAESNPTRGRWSVRRVAPELERAYVAGGWWTEDTLGALVARQLAAHPASTVTIWSRSRAWQGAYADIDDEARRLVSLLRELGVRPGDPVAFQLPNWREAVVSFAALTMGGYVVVPIVHIYGRKEVAFILEQSGAVAYISPRVYGHVDYGAIVETAAPASLRLHVVVDDAELAGPASPASAGRRAPNGSRPSTSPRCRPRTSRSSGTPPERRATPRA